MKELDILFASYLDCHYRDTELTEQQTFDQLLTLQDPHLYALFTGQSVLEDSKMQHLVEKIRTMNMENTYEQS